MNKAADGIKTLQPIRLIPHNADRTTRLTPHRFFFAHCVNLGGIV